MIVIDFPWFSNKKRRSHGPVPRCSTDLSPRCQVPGLLPGGPRGEREIPGGHGSATRRWRELEIYDVMLICWYVDIVAPGYIGSIGNYICIYIYYVICNMSFFVRCNCKMCLKMRVCVYIYILYKYINIYIWYYIYIDIIYIYWYYIYIYIYIFISIYWFIEYVHWYMGRCHIYIYWMMRCGMKIGWHKYGMVDISYVW